jgi:hypothetical protein
VFDILGCYPSAEVCKSITSTSVQGRRARTKLCEFTVKAILLWDTKPRSLKEKYRWFRGYFFVLSSDLAIKVGRAVAQAGSCRYLTAMAPAVSCQYLIAASRAVSCRYLTAVTLAVSCRYLTAVEQAISRHYLTAVALAVSCRYLTAVARIQSQGRSIWNVW